MAHFCITVRWLDDRYHGLLGRDGPPEWPPSPFRLFQALVAGVAGWGELDGSVGKSLKWLESRAPLIVAPRSVPGRIITHYVPNNDSDEKLDRQERLTGKTFRPTIMLDEPAVHYVWPIDGDCPQRQLIEATRSLSCLGWGVDMAYADGRVLSEGEAGKLHGIRWLPKPGTIRDDGLLRIPKEGSMLDLRTAHQSALDRINHRGPLRTVYKPQVFDRIVYASADRPLGRPCVVFDLRTTSDDIYRYQHARLISIAGMTRHAAKQAMENYPPGDVVDRVAWLESFVAGHRRDSMGSQERLSYIPLPSIGHEHADAMIRRVMIAAPFGCDAHLAHLADPLDGVQLEPEDGSEGPVLYRVQGDSVTRQYLGPSSIWASVTPVILPGHDDHKPAKTVRLIRRALLQSGIEEACEFTWGAIPNFPHCLTAHKYGPDGRLVGYQRPKYLDGLTAVHVRLTFEHPVAGPLFVGAGRHCGLGVLAAV
jgi:CRISPR-associated protein Csb2